jgi:23S rRNA pseudouridine955/2504/2580 synthase
MFKDHTCLKKTYIALVKGHTQDFGSITSYLKKNDSGYVENFLTPVDGAKESKLKYKTLKHYLDASLVEVELISGRTHQIRVQMASINHNVIGDKKYGDFITNHSFDVNFGLRDLCLHAYRLEVVRGMNSLTYLSNTNFVAPNNVDFDCILAKKR